VIRNAGVPGAFVRTGNFYENMVLRKYVAYDKEKDLITMTRPIITEKAESEYDAALIGISAEGSSHNIVCRERLGRCLQSHLGPVGNQKGHA
jgi:hypothetical protein